jgi:hypothetical protein
MLIKAIKFENNASMYFGKYITIEQYIVLKKAFEKLFYDRREGEIIDSYSPPKQNNKPLDK